MATGSADALEAIMIMLQMLQASNRELREQLSERFTVVAKENERRGNEIKGL